MAAAVVEEEDEDDVEDIVKEISLALLPCELDWRRIPIGSWLSHIYIMMYMRITTVTN